MPRLKTALQFEAIGTRWQISYDAQQPLDEAIHLMIETFDKIYSRFRKDSLVSKIAQASGAYKLPSNAAPLMHFYKKMYDATDGLVTPLIGSLMSDAGYDADYSLKPGVLKTVPVWDDVMSYEGTVLKTKQPILLDFGAAGKGYLVDLIVALFETNEVSGYVINAGGDIYAHGTTRVALENPETTDEAIGVATIRDQAICGSAGNRRKWAEFTHIMNPATKKSQTNIAATWVVADTAMVADGLATALFFTQPDALTQFEFEYALIKQDGSLYSSPNFPADFFIKE